MHFTKAERIKSSIILIVLMGMACLATPCCDASQLGLPTCAYTVRDMVEDTHGKIYVGTFGAGLWLINNQEITRQKSLEQQGLFPMISNLLIDGEKLWVATTGDSCNYITLSDLKFHKIQHTPRFSRLHALYLTNNNKILIGSVGSGAAILNKNENTYCWQPVRKKVLNHLSWINDINEWKNSIWLATANGAYHTPSGQNINNWQPKSEGLRSGANHFFPDKNKLFISTTSRGVFVKIGTKQAVPISGIHGETYFVTRFKNTLIAGGESGLWEIDKNRGKKIQSFHDHCAKSYLVTRKNSLLIGTMDGRIIETKDLKKFKLLAHLQVESIKEPNE